jgi:hypothetical protein
MFVRQKKSIKIKKNIKKLLNGILLNISFNKLTILDKSTTIFNQVFLCTNDIVFLSATKKVK